MNLRTIVWSSSAEEELAEIWLASIDRRAISLAVHQIDTHLRLRGIRAAVPVSEGLFAVECLPLRVLCEEIHADALIRILKVKRA